MSFCTLRILEAVERRAAGQRVTWVRLRVGTLHRVAEPGLSQAFSLVADGTVPRGPPSALAVVPVPGHLRRLPAGDRGRRGRFACAACGSTELTVIGGDELALESIQLQAPI
jgi:Zn finger protein HypA/HybF involved in hydrogenase expression